MDGQTQPETKRDRVRRLLLAPLAEMGFRFPKGTAPEEGQKRLDRIADELGYLDEANLVRLRESLRDKGEGSARRFWPAHATFVAYAQLAQPRPLHELPGIASWFASVAGQEALAAGRLVAEYRFWLRHHRPPMNDVERRRLAEQSRDAADRLARLRDKQGRGWRLDAADLAWLDAHQRDDARARTLIPETRA
ncbi:hypothetical protein KM176_24225 [Pseudooceanicola sp. CBS1P-1]|nr:hypothetical protein [Pseudooceanicola endophyticus]MBT9386969.1 hypothetical protein [Pseudooceanicola endophyticus]